MGAFVSSLSALLFPSADPALQRRAALERALKSLRAVRATLTGAIDVRRRRIKDHEREVLEMGLRHEHRRMAASERPALRHALKQRLLGTKRIERFYALLTTIEEQMALLEDSGAIAETVGALRLGASAQRHVQLDVDDVERLLEQVREQHEALADTSQMLADQSVANDTIASLDDKALDDELDMLYEQLAAEQSSDAMDAARRALAAAPCVPVENSDPLLEAAASAARTGTAHDTGAVVLRVAHAEPMMAL